MSNGKNRALLSFIESYRNLPELWDQHNPSYTNRAKKSAAYDILIEKLNAVEPESTRETVVKKINNIRTTFRKELKKVNDSKRSGGDVHVPSLWYFNDLLFLVDQEADHTKEHTPDPAESFDSNRSEDSIAGSQMPIISYESTSGSTCGTQASFVQNRKRKTESASEDLLLKATRYLEAEDDEFQIFAKGYAVKLRKLSPEQLMFADKVITEVLLDGHMGLLTRHSHVVHPQSTKSPL